jgi:hypothetical protein
MIKNQKSNFRQIERGEIVYLENLSLTVLIISNKMHNFFSNYLIILSVSDKDTDEILESLEVPFKLEGNKKFKVLVSCFHTIDKQSIYEEGTFLGQMSGKDLEVLNEKIKSILDLND